MKILVVASGLWHGSISILFHLLDMEKEEVLFKGLLERIGHEESSFVCECRTGTMTRSVTARNCAEGMRIALESLTEPQCAGLKDLSVLAAVGHRVVHGGEYFMDHCLVNDKVLEGIRKCVPLAPLHNPFNLQALETCFRMIPRVPQVAVFDTTFHQRIPDYAHIYALPYEYYEKYGIRRYGFHGPSHQYLMQRAAEMMGKSPASLRLITCHLGNGASVAAIREGRSIDTSMGFTPLEGLVMATRSGDMDPAVIPFLMQQEFFFQREIEGLLNKRSGLLGISGISGSMIELEREMSAGNERARLAVHVFCYRLKKYICSYLGVLGGLDAVVFSAGIGENSSYVRARTLEGLEFLGLRLDGMKNKVCRGESDIAVEKSPARILVIPTREELAIARETIKVLQFEKVKEESGTC
jgi:acetate kinase